MPPMAAVVGRRMSCHWLSGVTESVTPGRFGNGRTGSTRVVWALGASKEPGSRGLGGELKATATCAVTLATGRASDQINPILRGRRVARCISSPRNRERRGLADAAGDSLPSQVTRGRLKMSGSSATVRYCFLAPMVADSWSRQAFPASLFPRSGTSGRSGCRSHSLQTGFRCFLRLAPARCTSRRSIH